ncbi:arylsulfatase [Aquisalinus flavus]|uniref:N-acetylgalactosamine-6-sulfatase n=2 Tax=Aquisalinus flavus TaxID=1526572 RepID=A0A8J2V5G2_9PROT|nr:arylsulfatase [Aquisalinus flavus]GGD11519.1 N-acetylgalactosamine-6-sulfatase [Aquisalinus flavus]
MKKITAFTFGLVISACAASEQPADAISAQTSENAGEAPHVVLIMTDDQGYGDVGYTGNPLIRTPHIDALAGESARFTDFHVDPTCSPTRAALMTGQNSLRAGVWHTIMGRSLLPTEQVTIAEVLQGAGYATGIFGKWHLGDNYPFRPEDQGFEHTVIHGGGGVGQTPDYWGNTQFDDTYFVNSEPVGFTGNSTDVWFDEAEKFITGAAEEGRPSFTYLSLNAPHRPWRAPDEYIAPYLEAGLPAPMAKFYAMITHIDDRVGALREYLLKLEDGRDVVFIFMTDNGSAFHFNETYYQGNPETVSIQLAGDSGWQPNAGMRGYKASVYEGGHRVPLLISGPGIEGGRDIDVLSAHYDLYPTLLELAGLEVSGMDIDGVSLAPVLRGEAEAVGERAIVVTNQRVFDPDPGRPVAVLTEDWRYVANEPTGSEALFAIAEDPAQQSDVASAHPEVIAEMRAVIETWWDDAAATGFPTQRLPVGTPGVGTVRLTAMDWMEAPSTDAVPWFPGFQPPAAEIGYESWLQREEEFPPLPWYLTVETPGSYEIEVFVHDAPAAMPAGKDHAILEVDGQRHVVPVHGHASSARFTVDLNAGDARMLTWFADTPDGDNPLPAMYVYVTKVD